MILGKYPVVRLSEEYQGVTLNETEREWWRAGARFNDSWSMPNGIPLVLMDLNDSDMVDLSNSTLEKRDAGRTATFYKAPECPIGSGWKSVYSFKCDVACIVAYPNQIWSMRLTQQVDGNPRPSADVYTGFLCGLTQQQYLYSNA
jgi:hypothetical protein